MCVPKFEDATDHAIVNQVPNDLDLGTVAGLAGERQFCVVLLTRRHHLIGLLQCTTQWFFEVHMDTAFGGRDDDVTMLVKPAGADADNVWTRLVQ